ncbi:putative guanine nucleotide-binding protein G(I)/G(S)/G(O) subunit gamma-14 isoform X3 [Balaenoptera acutorostrata]|uniref:Guanine nucleotide-binding protein G(I)/G(S)/G(O) subunit gamma-14 isoform X3 n=1 Tax=Balaenoptera acutorostrata TaxID=9767 RepID=A0ABM3T330_BALAC|nr:putative guanine nucleotide-binding protein G(I)/G(S)/G(O) subunit gamma-14 isoform X3 [Balaenoptera acutorostrata]
MLHNLLVFLPLAAAAVTSSGKPSLTFFWPPCWAPSPSVHPPAVAREFLKQKSDARQGDHWQRHRAGPLSRGAAADGGGHRPCEGIQGGH